MKLLLALKSFININILETDNKSILSGFIYNLSIDIDSLVICKYNFPFQISTTFYKWVPHIHNYRTIYGCICILSLAFTDCLYWSFRTVALNLPNSASLRPPIIKLFSLLLHYCNFGTVTNRIVNI